MYLLAIFISSLEKCLFSPLLILNQVVFLLLSFRGSLYILTINPICMIANIASQSLGCLFTLLILSLHVQKFFNFIKFHLFFVVVAYAFDVISKIIIARSKIVKLSSYVSF